LPATQEVLRSIQPTGARNLSLLTAGSSTETHVVNPLRVRQLLSILRAQYQLILIDVPPMLQIADARMIAAETDGVVLVLRSNVTPINSAVLACQLLAEDGANLVGTILNDFDVSQPGARKYLPYISERAIA
jgi:Mrp family chromosome partitioning ATPase